MGELPALEICTDTLAGCLAAQAGGADRIELCAGLSEGGLSPSRGVLEEALARVRLPIVVLVRPRRGDFLYDAPELAAMERDVRDAREAGAAGVALGVLAEDGTLDRARTGALVAAANPLPVTLHRAFDLVRDQDEALDAALELGIARVLTSGGAPDAWSGRERLRSLVRRAAGALEVMAGGGVRADNVSELARTSGVQAVHASARATRASAMRWRREGLSLGAAAAMDEYSLSTADAAVVAALAAALRER